MFKINKNNDVPDGFRTLNDEEIAAAFLLSDKDKSYTVTKNEWMAGCLSVLVKDVESLDREAPDAIMNRIRELSDEFDGYDTDGNKVIDYLEYKEFITKKLLISE